MKFTFRKPKEMIAWLEFQSMDHKGVILPLHYGINHIGKSVKGYCLYNERKQLRGIVEQAQVFIRINNDGSWVTDATSTNQSKLITGTSAAATIQGLQTDYLSYKKAIYFESFQKIENRLLIQ